MRTPKASRNLNEQPVNFARSAFGVRRVLASLFRISITVMPGSLVLVKDDPGQIGINDCQTGVDQRRRRRITFEMIGSDNPPGDQRKSQSADDTDHPGWKIRTENIDCRRTVTHRSNHEDQYPDQQDQSCKRDVSGPTSPRRWKIRNNSRLCFHLRGCLTSGGAGRARSPTLSASAA